MQYGNLLSLPFDNGMLYVEPVYVKSNQQNAYPLLQKVLLSYGDGGSYVSLANTLEEGIKDLVAQGERARQGQPQPPPGETPPTPTNPNAPTMSAELQAAANRVSTAIDKVREAQEAGDFTALRRGAHRARRGDGRLPGGPARGAQRRRRRVTRRHRRRPAATQGPSPGASPGG